MKGIAPSLTKYRNWGYNPTGLNDLKNRIESREARVGVLGLGYVGLPLALAFAKAGFHVTGYDVDPKRIAALNKSRSYIGDVPSTELTSQIRSNHFRASTSFTSLGQMDALIICVPTPLNKTKDPDISFIDRAARMIGRTLRKGQLIVLESTSYPGTTREHVLPLLAASGLHVGRDFFLAFSPERIDPGNSRFKLHNTPKVVGGMTPACAGMTELLYKQIIQRVIAVSNAETAELTKLLENTFRAINIGMVNEMLMICDKLKLNAWEVIEAAATKPYGFMPFYPGPGLGGHCIPVDPQYLSWKMKSLNFTARFIELASDINGHMPEFTVQKIIRVLNESKKTIKGASVLILGAAYKPNVSDVRESPALDVLHLLREHGAKVAYHDPYVPLLHVAGHRFKSQQLTSALLKRMDVVVIITAHSAFDPKTILTHSRLVVDTRNLFRKFVSSKLVRL